MSELEGISERELEPFEHAQHRLMWTERKIYKAQRGAWALWFLRILPASAAIIGGVIGLLTLISTLVVK